MEKGATADVINPSQSKGSEGSGEPKGSASPSGEPEKNSGSAKGEPGSEGLFDGMDGATLHKSYKKLQGEYGRIQNEIVKKFEPYGGAEQVLQWTDYLSKNPDFAQWVTAQKTKSALGIDESQLDDQTKAALDAVRKIAKTVVDEEVGRLRTREIAPINETQTQDLIDRHFDAMDKKYGEDWREMQDLMSELSDDLPDSIQNKPTLEDMEDLYFKALRKSNKLESYAAKKLQKTITEKKSKATDKPASAGESTPKKAMSIAEAFAQAKQAQT
jgi:hypothetical protein